MFIASELGSTIGSNSIVFFDSCVDRPLEMGVCQSTTAPVLEINTEAAKPQDRSEAVAQVADIDRSKRGLGSRGPSHSAKRGAVAVAVADGQLIAALQPPPAQQPAALTKPPKILPPTQSSSADLDDTAEDEEKRRSLPSKASGEQPVLSLTIVSEGDEKLPAAAAANAAALARSPPHKGLSGRAGHTPTLSLYGSNASATSNSSSPTTHAAASAQTLGTMQTTLPGPASTASPHSQTQSTTHTSGAPTQTLALPAPAPRGALSIVLNGAMTPSPKHSHARKQSHDAFSVSPRVPEPAKHLRVRVMSSYLSQGPTSGSPATAIAAGLGLTLNTTTQPPPSTTAATNTTTNTLARAPPAHALSTASSGMAPHAPGLSIQVRNSMSVWGTGGWASRASSRPTSPAAASPVAVSPGLFSVFDFFFLWCFFLFWLIFFLLLF